jgi:AcrR family transcriptional regulator
VRSVAYCVTAKGIALRKQSSERIGEIVRTATEVIGERGFFGMTIQEVADRTGLSQAGVLKHVKNKQNLLNLILRQYDFNEDGNSSNSYLVRKLNLSGEELDKHPALMPEWYREIAQFNAENPYQTRAYLVLRAEALDESHPAHEYFAHRGKRLRKQVEQVPWKLPPEYSKPEQVGLLSMAIGSAMEGLESRWLGEPDIDFLQTWAAYEDILFPLPHWKDYR